MLVARQSLSGCPQRGSDSDPSTRSTLGLAVDGNNAHMVDGGRLKSMQTDRSAFAVDPPRAHSSGITQTQANQEQTSVRRAPVRHVIASRRCRRLPLKTHALCTSSSSSSQLIDLQLKYIQQKRICTYMRIRCKDIDYMSVRSNIKNKNHI